MHKHHHPFTTRSTRLLVAPAVVAAGLVAVPALTAAANETPVACGTVVTSDVRLTHDLLDCAGSGLVVGAPGVTIDLAGHVIDGTGTGAGIDNEAGHDDVEIRQGTIREFLFGVHLFETSGFRVDGVAVESNARGFIVSRSADGELDRVTATDTESEGIEVLFSEGITVRRSTAVENASSGIVDRASVDSRYERNTVTGNGGWGLTLQGSLLPVVDRNHVAGNDIDGIELLFVEDALIERNEVVGNAQHGITIDRPGNTVARNRAVDNGGIGIAAPEGTIDGGHNRATGNLGGDCTGVVCG